MVVKKLWPAVPERRFVFIALKDKFCAAAQAVALPEVLRDSSNQEIRLPTRRMKNPRQHRRSGRLPVRAADHNGMLAEEKYFFKDFRQRAVRNSPIQNFL